MVNITAVTSGDSQQSGAKDAQPALTLGAAAEG